MKNMVDIDKMKRRTNSIIKKLIGMIIGAILIAVSYNALVIPNGLLSGGVSGMALIGKYTLDLPLYVGMLLLNIPIFILGFKELDKKFMIYSVIGTAVMIFAIPLTRPFIPTPKLDLFLASVFSGVIGGVGSGLFLKTGASSGGTDIVATIMKKKKNISIGSFSFFVNIGVLSVSLLFFELNIALYTAVSMWVGGKITDAVIEGLNKNKSIMIISDRSDEVAEKIMNELNRGITYLVGQGAYSKEEKMVINCVVNHYEIAKVKEILLEVDPKAFMFVTETAEVKGKGFSW